MEGAPQHVETELGGNEHQERRRDGPWVRVGHKGQPEDQNRDKNRNAAGFAQLKQLADLRGTHMGRERSVSALHGLIVMDRRMIWLVFLARVFQTPTPRAVEEAKNPAIAGKNSHACPMAQRVD